MSTNQSDVFAVTGNVCAWNMCIFLIYSWLVYTCFKKNNPNWFRNIPNSSADHQFMVLQCRWSPAVCSSGGSGSSSADHIILLEIGMWFTIFSGCHPLLFLARFSCHCPSACSAGIIWTLLRLLTNTQCEIRPCSVGFLSLTRGEGAVEVHILAAVNVEGRRTCAHPRLSDTVALSCTPSCVIQTHKASFSVCGWFWKPSL